MGLNLQIFIYSTRSDILTTKPYSLSNVICSSVWIFPFCILQLEKWKHKTNVKVRMRVSREVRLSPLGGSSSPVWTCFPWAMGHGCGPIRSALEGFSFSVYAEGLSVGLCKLLLVGIQSFCGQTQSSCHHLSIVLSLLLLCHWMLNKHIIELVLTYFYLNASELCVFVCVYPGKHNLWGVRKT